MKLRLKSVVVLSSVVLYAMMGWLGGLVVLAIAVVVVSRRFLRTRRALAPTIACPWCHEAVDQYGPFSCAQCHARTLGWAWRCPFCAAWAGHLDCPHCGMSVSNPILGAP